MKCFFFLLGLMAIGTASERILENSLGMKFIPLAGTSVALSQYETRRSDFEMFVRETGFSTRGVMWSLHGGRWARHGATWQSPGFEQTGAHPVVGVSWEDAQRFCAWLTERERKRGLLNGHQFYRLPQAEEWRKAVGGGEYVWGGVWPPPNGSENLAGEEVVATGWPRFWKHLEGYQDQHPRTAPVGSYAPNALGFYDLGGNVIEWGEDFFQEGDTPRILLGGGWSGSLQVHLKSARRGKAEPGFCSDQVGFRCVRAQAIE